MFVREFSGIPCIMLGSAMHRLESWPVNRFAGIFLAGLAILVLEAVGANAIGLRTTNLQWSVSTPIVAFGLFGLAIRTRQVAPSWFAEWGRRDSLGLYLYHPALMVVAASLLAGQLKMYYDDLPGLPLWGLTVVLTLGVLQLLRLAPRLRALAEGDFESALRREAQPSAASAR